jgi:putative ABC transport system permease protein
MIIFKKIFSKMRIKIALRNILRHRLRSVLSVGMIGGAVCAIVLFQGLSDFMLEALKYIAAENQFGNMQIAQERYWNPGAESREKRMFPLQNLEHLKIQNNDIQSISGRLSFYGLVSTGSLTIATKLIGIDPLGEPNFAKSMKILDGKFYENNEAHEAMIGFLLAKQLNIKAGDNITLVANTVDGIINAMDLVVSGVFSAGIDVIDSQVIYAPISVAQTILDTKNVDIAVVKFKKLPLVEMNLDKVKNFLSKSYPNLVAKPWRELASLFRQVEKFYSVQNKLIEGILLALMFLGILNAVSMTVVERVGEIGTLRSFGESGSEVVGQFILESLVLAIIGIVIGTFAAFSFIELLKVVQIKTEMPGASLPFVLKINFLFSAVAYASFLAIVTTFIATYLPARKAAKLNIVEALRKNI